MATRPHEAITFHDPLISRSGHMISFSEEVLEESASGFAPGYYANCHECHWFLFIEPEPEGFHNWLEVEVNLPRIEDPQADADWDTLIVGRISPDTPKAAIYRVAVGMSQKHLDREEAKHNDRS